jgi:hypothetical protein
MIGRRSHDDAQSFEEAWSGRAPADDHVAELVRFAESLCEAAVAGPTPAFRDSLRTQLMAEAATVLVPIAPESRATTRVAPARTSRPVRRRVTRLTAALVASVGVVGIVASSASAVPGEVLYPVKRSVESVQLAMHRDDASRGSFQLHQAAERLAEAQQLTAKGGSDHERLVSDTLEDFSTQAESGSTALFSDYTGNGEEKSIREVNDFAVEATAELSALSAQLPNGADDSFDAATSTISRLATQATSLCDSCTTGDLQQLASSVKNLGGTPKPHATKDSSSSTDSGTSASNDPTKAAPGTTAPQPTKKPVAALPAPTTAPTTKAPSLSDVTDPLLGAVLGNDKQEGLIPGLLNGLLGGGKK